jgi:putative transposase
VDVGVKTLAVLSDGTEIQGNKPSKKYTKRLRRAQQSLSRKKGSRKGEKKSANYRKQQRKVSRLHEKIANSRNDGLHKLSSMLTQNYSLIGIEDLNVKGMVKNHNLAKAIHDQSWSELGRQLTYKAEVTGSHVHYSDRFFASSQLCNACGYQYVETKDLSVREWTCPECGVIHDRDQNAAENLKLDAIRAVFGAA